MDHAGHVFGPDSNELKLMMTHVDNVLQEFMNNMKLQGMQNQVDCGLMIHARVIIPFTILFS